MCVRACLGLRESRFGAGAHDVINGCPHPAQPSIAAGSAVGSRLILIINMKYIGTIFARRAKRGTHTKYTIIAPYIELNCATSFSAAARAPGPGSRRAAGVLLEILLEHQIPSANR